MTKLIHNLIVVLPPRATRALAGCIVVAGCLVSAAPAAASGLPPVTYTPGTQQAHSLYGYPWPNAPECTNGGACLNDTWGFSQGQCVSWVAYRIRQLNGPFAGYPGPGWLSANNWGPHAQGVGMPVHASPGPGSVAWYSYGHVAYVEAVASPTSVEISEMNFDDANAFRIEWISPGHHWPTAFIHIHDRLPASGPTGSFHPSVAVWPSGTRYAGQQDVFWHGSGSNGIWEAVWNNGWHGPSPVPGVTNAASSPTAAVNGPRNEEEIFYKGADGQLWEVLWAGRWYAPHAVGMGPLGSEPSVAVWPSGTRYAGQQDGQQQPRCLGPREHLGDDRRRALEMLEVVQDDERRSTVERVDEGIDGAPAVSQVSTEGCGSRCGDELRVANGGQRDELHDLELVLKSLRDGESDSCLADPRSAGDGQQPRVGTPEDRRRPVHVLVAAHQERGGSWELGPHTSRSVG